MMMMEKIWDKGPWEVRDTDRGVMIDSDDFTHDASLIVYGDFRDTETKIKYAEYIASILNDARIARIAANYGDMPEPSESKT